MNMRSLIFTLVCIMLTAITAHQGISAEREIETALDPAALSGTGASEAEAAADLIDINSADAALLITLPGIGPKTAGKITVYREANGPFKTVDELLNISGIGPQKLEKIRLLVKIS
jgi:competence protein ComEA